MRPAGRLFFAVITTLLVIVVGACSDGPETNPQLELNSRSLVPQDSELASVYDRSCRNCHTVAGTGAPLTGDAASWSERIKEKGMPVLLNNVVNGSGGMPPFGLCMDCSSEQFEALIKFMAQAT